MTHKAFSDLVCVFKNLQIAVEKLMWCCGLSLVVFRHKMSWLGLGKYHTSGWKTVLWLQGFCCHSYNSKQLVKAETVKKQRLPTECLFPVSVLHGFHHGPAPLGDRKESWVHSFLWEKWKWSQIMINFLTTSSPRHIMHPFFTRHVSSEHSDTKMAFFRHTIQEKINFVRDPSVSQQYSCEIWEPVLSALLRNGYKQTFKWSYRWNHELKFKTYLKQISGDAKSICFNPFTRRYNTSRQGGGMVVPKCLCERRDSAHLGDGKSIYHFTPLAQSIVWILVLYWISLLRLENDCGHGLILLTVSLKQETNSIHIQYFVDPSIHTDIVLMQTMLLYNKVSGLPSLLLS